MDAKRKEYWIDKAIKYLDRKCIDDQIELAEVMIEFAEAYAKHDRERIAKEINEELQDALITYEGEYLEGFLEAIRVAKIVMKNT